MMPDAIDNSVEDILQQDECAESDDIEECAEEDD